MNPIELSESDVIHHVVIFGLDIYPPIVISQESTRLNLFYEEAKSRHPELFDQVLAGDKQFRLSKRFDGQHNNTITIQTFEITARGPLFFFPLVLLDVAAGFKPDLIASTFHELWDLFQRTIGGRQLLRVGMVRDLMLDVGKAKASEVVFRRHKFSDAKLSAGSVKMLFTDEKLIYMIEVEPGAVDKTTKVAGAAIKERHANAIKVKLDVGTREMRPLGNEDIDRVIDTATGLWPIDLLGWLAEEV